MIDHLREVIDHFREVIDHFRNVIDLRRVHDVLVDEPIDPIREVIDQFFQTADRATGSLGPDTFNGIPPTASEMRHFLK